MSGVGFVRVFFLFVFFFFFLSFSFFCPLRLPARCGCLLGWTRSDGNDHDPEAKEKTAGARARAREPALRSFSVPARPRLSCIAFLRADIVFAAFYIRLLLSAFLPALTLFSSRPLLTSVKPRVSGIFSGDSRMRFYGGSLQEPVSPNPMMALTGIPFYISLYTRRFIDV